MFEASGGVPRVINRLCDRALQRGHQARARRSGPTWCERHRRFAARPAPRGRTFAQRSCPRPCRWRRCWHRSRRLMRRSLMNRRLQSRRSARHRRRSAVSAAQGPRNLLPNPSRRRCAVRRSRPLGPDDLRALLSLPPTAPCRGRRPGGAAADRSGAGRPRSAPGAVRGPSQRLKPPACARPSRRR